MPRFPNESDRLMRSRLPGRGALIILLPVRRTWPPRPILVGRADPADLEPLPRRPAPPRLGPTGFDVLLRAPDRSIGSNRRCRESIIRAGILAPWHNSRRYSPPHLPPDNSTHFHANTPSKPQPDFGCKSFLLKELRFSNLSPQPPPRKFPRTLDGICMTA